MGAAGFLGRHFTTHHLDAGDTVTAVDNFSSGRAAWAPGRYEQSYMDAASFLIGSDTYDIAYHFAAPVGGREKIEGDPLFNADSLRLDAAFFRWAAGKVGLAVYPSSSAVYPAALQADEGVALRESDFDPAKDYWGRPDELYGFTKMAGEVLAAKAERYGLATLVLRPFSGYGEGQSEDYPVTAICKRALAHEDPLVVWGSGRQRRDFIHVSDIVGLVTAIIPHHASGYTAINVGSGVPVSFVEVARHAAAIAGYAPTVVTDESKPEGVSSRFCDPSRMNRLYTPKVGLIEGLVRVMDSIRGQQPGGSA